jgi:hypothetical protein
MGCLPGAEVGWYWSAHEPVGFSGTPNSRDASPNTPSRLACVIKGRASKASGKRQVASAPRAPRVFGRGSRRASAAGSPGSGSIAPLLGLGVSVGCGVWGGAGVVAPLISRVSEPGSQPGYKRRSADAVLSWPSPPSPMGCFSAGGFPAIAAIASLTSPG